MTVDTWHAPPELLLRFAREPETIEPVTAASVEQHLVRCETCRRAVADATNPAALDALWADIADRVDRNAHPRARRMLGGPLLDHASVRLVAGTDLLQLEALGAIVALTVGAFLVAGELDSSAPFVAFAPLAVLGVVALAFMPGAEPTGEVAPSTPLFGFGLFIRRAVTVLVATIIPLIAASTVLPGPGLEPLAWVLPSLALALGALALSTRYGPTAASAVVATGWMSAIVVVARIGSPTRLPAHLLATPSVQAFAIAVALCSALVLFQRRDRFDQIRLHGGLL